MTKQTNDKIPVQQLLIPNYILNISNFLTKVSPWLASRLAARLFLTPFRYKLPEREKEMDAQSKQTLIEVPKINREIMVYDYGQSNKKILMVHGWSGRGTQLAKIAKILKNKGFEIISFDAPGHGKAPGKMSMMPFFIEAIHFLDQQHGPFHAVIGHSLGAMSILRSIREGLETKKLVIIGAANSVTHITEEFARNMKMNDHIASKMKHYLEDKLNQDFEEYSGAVSAKQVPTPTLIIHDKADVDVDIRDAYAIHEALDNSIIYVTEGLGHRRVLGDPAVINKITTFITA